MAKGDRTVYSTGPGGAPVTPSRCPRCGKPAKRCRCAAQIAERDARSAQSDGVVRIRREVKGRGGKTVTTISGLPGDDAELRALAKELKQLCGTGGSLKDGVVEIQGEHRDKLADALRARGLEVKFSGG